MAELSEALLPNDHLPALSPPPAAPASAATAAMHQPTGPASPSSSTAPPMGVSLVSEHSVGESKQAMLSSYASSSGTFPSLASPSAASASAALLTPPRSHARTASSPAPAAAAAKLHSSLTVLPVHAAVRPQVKLETLSKRAVKTVLILTYFFLFTCMAVGFLETDYTKVEELFTFSSGGAVTAPGARTSQLADGSQTMNFQLAPWNLYFDLEARAVRGGGGALGGLPSEDRALNVSLLLTVSWHGETVLLFSDNEILDTHFPGDSALSDPFILLASDDYSYSYERSQLSFIPPSSALLFNLTFLVHSDDGGSGGGAALNSSSALISAITLSYPPTSYRIVSIILHLLLIILTSCYLVHWVGQLKEKDRQRVEETNEKILRKEQRKAKKSLAAKRSAALSSASSGDEAAAAAEAGGVAPSASSRNLKLSVVGAQISHSLAVARSFLFSWLSRGLPEQQWITYLLISLLLYQDPFFLPLIFYPSATFRVLSGLVFYTSFSYCTFFWLSMLSAAKATGKQINKWKEQEEARKLEKKNAFQRIRDKIKEEFANLTASAQNPAAAAAAAAAASAASSSSAATAVTIAAEPSDSPIPAARPLSDEAQPSPLGMKQLSPRSASLEAEQKLPPAATSAAAAAAAAAAAPAAAPAAPVRDAKEAKMDELRRLRGEGMYSYSSSFYFPKIILCSLIFLSSTIAFLLYSLPSTHDISTGAASSSVLAPTGQPATAYNPYYSNREFDRSLHTVWYYSSARSAAIIVFAVLLFVCLSIWFLWMMRATCAGNTYLRKLPYLATRFRQLSFRFFIFQTWLCILYFAFVITIQLATKGINELHIGVSGERTGLVSTALLISFYIYLVSFIYLPVIEKKKPPADELPAAAAAEPTAATAAVGAAAGGVAGEDEATRKERIREEINKQIYHRYIDDESEQMLAGADERSADGRRRSSGGGGADGARHHSITQSTASRFLPGIAVKSMQAVYALLFGNDGPDSLLAKRLHFFSLETARLLTDFAWAAYYSPPLPDALALFPSFDELTAAAESKSEKEKKSTPSLSSAPAPPLQQRASTADSENSTTATVKISLGPAPGLAAADAPADAAGGSADASESLLVPLALLDPEQTANTFRKKEYINLNERGWTCCFYHVRAATDTHCFIARGRDGTEGERTIIVGFRGTASSTNARTDLAFARTKWTPEGAAQPVGNVHSGFLLAWNSVRDALLQKVDELVRADRRSYLTRGPLQIFCTGHSLGGALATLATYELTQRYPLPHASIHLYNFGSPRVGDHKFARAYDDACPFSYRIVFDRDLITSMPKFFFLYKHVGLEFIIDAIGNLIVDPTFLEKTFLSSRRSIRDHLLSSYIVGLDQALLQLSAESQILFERQAQREEKAAAERKSNASDGSSAAGGGGGGDGGEGDEDDFFDDEMDGGEAEESVANLDRRVAVAKKHSYSWAAKLRGYSVVVDNAPALRGPATRNRMESEAAVYEKTAARSARGITVAALESGGGDGSGAADITAVGNRSLMAHSSSAASLAALAAANGSLSPRGGALTAAAAGADGKRRADTAAEGGVVSSAVSHGLAALTSASTLSTWHNREALPHSHSALTLTASDSPQLVVKVLSDRAGDEKMKGADAADDLTAAASSSAPHSAAAAAGAGDSPLSAALRRKKIDRQRSKERRVATAAESDLMDEMEQAALVDQGSLAQRDALLQEYDEIDTRAGVKQRADDDDDSIVQFHSLPILRHFLGK